MKILETFIEYYRFFGEYINPVSVIAAGIMAAAIAALVLLLLLIVFRKRVLAKRRYPILKVLAWLYFLAIPLLGIYFAFQWGALNNMQQQLKVNLMAKMKDYNEGMDTSWEKYISQALTTGITDGSVPTIELSANNVVEIATEALYLRYQTSIDTTFGNTDNIAVNAIAYINHLTDGKVMSYAVKKGIYKLLESSLAMDEDMSTELMETRLDELLKQGILSKILGLQIDRVFKPLKQATILVFLIILAFPIFEIVLANYWLYEQEKAAIDKLQPDPNAPEPLGDNTTPGT